MPSQIIINELVKEFDKKLGDRSFLTLPELVSLGVFGTVQSARNSLKGKLIKVSQRRCIILRVSLYEWLREKAQNDLG